MRSECDLSAIWVRPRLRSECDLSAIWVRSESQCFDALDDRVAYVWHRRCRPHATPSGLRIHARRSLSTTWPRCRRGYVRSSSRSTSSAPPRRSPSVQSMPSRPSVKSFTTNRTRSSRLWAPARLVPPASLQQGRHGVVHCVVERAFFKAFDPENCGRAGWRLGAHCLVFVHRIRERTRGGGL